MAALVFGPDAWAPLAEALVAFTEGDEEAVLLVTMFPREPKRRMPCQLFEDTLLLAMVLLLLWLEEKKKLR